MLFNSTAFAYFFVALLAAGFLFPQKWMKGLMLVASLFFYAFWYPPYLILLLISVAIDYYCGQGIAKSYKNGDDKHTNYLWLSVILNLGILFAFKYLHFAASIFNISLPENFSWALPLGISFFTFQTMAYTIDVHRKEVEARTNFADFLLFICFFPQLIAGPILRIKESWDEVLKPQKPELKSLHAGIYLMIWGLMKKMLIADNLAGFVEECFKASETGGDLNLVMAWIGVYAFAAQIYCDFSGYVDTALGVARIFKIELPDNFNFPYMSRSITELWRRWHITLSSWLKDYLYIPLGGNQHGLVMQYRNLVLTMLLGGLWHGANWTFVVWGGIHGLWLGVEKFFSKIFLSDKKIIGSIIAWFVTFHITCLAWVFFRASSIESAWAYCLKLFTPGSTALSETAMNSIGILAVAAALHIWNAKSDFKNKIQNLNLEFRFLYILIAIILLALFGVHQEARFIYFDF